MFFITAILYLIPYLVFGFLLTYGLRHYLKLRDDQSKFELVDFFFPMCVLLWPSIIIAMVLMWAFVDVIGKYITLGYNKLTPTLDASFNRMFSRTKNSNVRGKDLDNEFGFVMYLGNNLSVEERLKAIVNLRWMLRCFLSAICDCYRVGAPRREQACNMVENYARKAHRQLSAEDWAVFCNGMIDPDTGKVYCRNSDA